MLVEVSEIWGLLKLVGANVNAKGLVDLVVGNFTIKDISLSTFKSLENNDEKRIDIIRKIFIDRQIMWQKFDRETILLCINSLQSLIDYCEQEGSLLMESNLNDNKFYGKLLKQLSTYAMRSIHEFKHAQEQRALIKSTAGFNDDLEDMDLIPDMLKTFRLDALPIVKIFIDLLNPKDPQRVDAITLFDRSMKILIEFHGVAYNEILKPYWEYKSTLS